jgi:formate hydrogenlyase transcriptional activator
MRESAQKGEIRPSSQQYRTLLEVAESIASNRELSALFKDLAGLLRRVVRFDYLWLNLSDGAGDALRLRVMEPPDLAPPETLITVQDAATWAWQNQRPAVTSGMAEAAAWPHYHQWAQRLGMNSLCVLPLTTAGRRLGAISFGCKQPGVYDNQDVDFLRLVANQVAAAVDHALNYEAVSASQSQLACERDRMRLLLEVNNAVVSHLDLDDLFTAVSACLRKVIPHDSSGLVLCDQETGWYRVHVLHFARNESFIEEGRVESEGGMKSPAAIAITTRRPAVFGEEDLKKLAAESPCAQYFLAEGVKAFCSVPLLSHDRALGALTVARRREDTFGPKDIDLLSEVAKQITIAVENAQAYREISELKDKLAKEKLYLEEEVRTEYSFAEIVGHSETLKRTLKAVETVAPTDSVVLIQGETGTGKELIARAIHNLSARRERTLVKLNCAAIPSGLLESELFGHERGAFTGAIERRTGRFEVAHKGTLFLDEVGDIPLELQPKLLRVLQEQEFERLGNSRTVRVDVRVIAATNRDLAQMVADNQFRADLYYRLNVFPVRTPPLRERPEDIPLLVAYFAQHHARRLNKRIESIPAEAMNALRRHTWAGNVRELENFIERAVIITRGSHLQIPLAELKTEIGANGGGKVALPARLVSMEEMERAHIEEVLRHTGGRIGGAGGAAEILGLPVSTLRSRMKKLGIRFAR